MFETYTWLLLTLIVLGVLWGAYKRRDTLHPLVYLLPMAGYLYVYIPYQLQASRALAESFTMDELGLVQGFNLACIAAVMLGTRLGDQGVQRDEQRVSRFTASLTVGRRHALQRIAFTVGGIGLFLFVLGIYNVGGFVEAFDSPKGGGWAPTGYLRDLKLLVIPGIVLYYLSRRGHPWSWGDRAIIALFSLPLLTRALLASSRGWTFMAVIALIGGWYLVQDRRPQLSVALAGGTIVWILMLVLVAYRGEIYIGSTFFSGDRPAVTEMVDTALDRNEQGGIGNEFIYGTHVVLLADEENDHYWGKRYLAYTLIRPIPSIVWASKYEDVGVSGIRWNAGTLGEKQSAPIYEQFPDGMYPGLAGDLFVEFAWGGIFAALIFGWIYGKAWRNHLTKGGRWTVFYHSLVATSVFAMMQTIAAAFLARVLIMTIIPLFFWSIWMPKSKRTRQIV